MLREAGFTPGDPNEILNGAELKYVRGDVQKYKGITYFDRKKWASQNSRVDGRLPLITAAIQSRKWKYVKQVFDLYMPVIEGKDGLTGLPLFMLAAIGGDSDFESVYNLLREYPAAIQYEIDIFE